MASACSDRGCCRPESDALIYMKRIPFFRHDLGTTELESLQKVLRGSILTTGATVADFERKFAAWLGRRYAVGVTSCTGGLHIALEALGIGPGDEVITTPMTFIATATSILHAGARPVFVDIEPDTGNIDVSRIAKAVTRRTRAIIPVHLYGQMCDMRSLRKIADKHGLAIIEDAAHCVEGKRDGIRPGELSDAACFSFYATKNLSCGEGGAVVTDRSDLQKKIRLLRLHGMNKMAADREREGYSHWDMQVLGWKYNMSNLQAALLLPQLKRLKQTHAKRQMLADRYTELLKDIPGISFLKEHDSVVHAQHLFVVQIAKHRRNSTIKKLQKIGISMMVNYRAIHLLTYFKKTYNFSASDFPMAKAFGEKVISLPFYPSMSYKDQEFVVKGLSKALHSR